MFSLVLIVGLAGAIVAASILTQRPNVDHRVTALLLGNYVLRLVLAPWTQNLNAFTSAPTDYYGYEWSGGIIARLWRYGSIHYVGGDEIPSLEHTSLPSNIFACVIYLNGEPTHFGCTAVVAATACFVCLNLYLLSLLLGAQPKHALWTAGMVGILPNFLFYTCNTFKDGFVAFFVIGLFGCAIRLARKISIAQLALGAVFLAGLWLTRFYLVFVVPAPFLLGFLGLRSRSVLRTAVATLAVGATLIALYAHSSAPDAVIGHARTTFEEATSDSVLSGNAEGGSGVLFDGASPAASFLPKLTYTLFSPFPWQPGSLALQIGKIEAFVWYYFFYRAVRSAKVMWRDQRADLLMFASLIVPLTVAYALSFSNIGLIVRQRTGIVIAVMLMASLSWGRGRENEPERDENEEVDARRTFATRRVA
jgi:hypothetical protein